MVYEDLNLVKKNLKIKWYRSPVDIKNLRELSKANNFRGLIQALGFLSLYSLTLVTTVFFYIKNYYFLFFIFLFLHGTISSFAIFANHELKHGTVFKNNFLNEFFLNIFSIICWFNYHEYSFSHTYHHKYTLHPQGDREVLLPLKPSLNIFYLFQLFTINIFGGLESNGIVPVIKNNLITSFNFYVSEWHKSIYKGHIKERQKAIYLSRKILLFHFIFILFCLFYNLEILIIVFSLSIFIGNWLRYFVGLTMHCGLKSNSFDFRKSVRSIKLNPFIEFIYWYMNYHLEHHMYASVPCYNLKKLHSLIKQDLPKRKSLIKAWIEMRNTWKLQMSNPSYEYDTILPTTYSNNSNYKEFDIHNSFGKLSPKPLKNL